MRHAVTGIVCLVVGLWAGPGAAQPDGGEEEAHSSRRVERPPVTKGDLGTEIGGGVTGMLAGPAAGALAGGIVAWSIDGVVGVGVGADPNVAVGTTELAGLAIGAPVGLLVGVRGGLAIAGNNSGGLGKTGATYLGGITGLFSGGLLWGGMALGTRHPSLGFGIPVTAFGLVSGSVIGYRLSAPDERPQSSERAMKVMPLAAPTSPSSGWAGVSVRW